MACLWAPLFVCPMKNRNLEETIKEKVSPLLEETMEKSWGITIPQLETDITDRLKNPRLQFYVPAASTFEQAKRLFKIEFMKKELRLHQGNISHLAKTLDLDRRSIHRTIKELDLDVQEIRHLPESREEYQQHMVDEVIRKSLDQYKDLIQPEKMDKMYQQVSTLSRNIAKHLPHHDLTWKEAEREFETQFLEHALVEQGGNISKTAQKIEIRVETLYRKVKKLGLRSQ